MVYVELEQVKNNIQYENKNNMYLYNDEMVICFVNQETTLTKNWKSWSLNIPGKIKLA